MISLETFLFYTLLCILAPIFGAFVLSFTMFFEKHIDVLKKETIHLSLERELQVAKNQQLSQQIKPHFFFNTLSTILILARLDRKKELINSLEVLSKFFKYRYETSKPLVPLSEEVDYMNDYLKLQKFRFGNRLVIEQDISQSLDNPLVPPYLLQTLVENAFKHGFEKISGPAILKVSIYTSERSLNVQVLNTNKIKSNEQMTNYKFSNDGYGLKNIRSRLIILFPNHSPKITVKYNNNEALVHICFPYVNSDYNLNELY